MVSITWLSFRSLSSSARMIITSGYSCVSISTLCSSCLSRRSVLVVHEKHWWVVESTNQHKPPRHLNSDPQEFMSSFISLHGNLRRIVVTSDEDRHPTAIPGQSITSEDVEAIKLNDGGMMACFKMSLCDDGYFCVVAGELH